MSANGVLHLSGPQRTARVRLVPSFATALLAAILSILSKGIRVVPYV